MIDTPGPTLDEALAWADDPVGRIASIDERYVVVLAAEVRVQRAKWDELTAWVESGRTRYTYGGTSIEAVACKMCSLDAAPVPRKEAT